MQLTVTIIRFIKPHIALLLLALFCVTWVPASLFHQHEAEVHLIAQLAHDEDHACEFDQNYCNNHDAGACGHTQHLEKSHEHCLSCQFHFTKDYLQSQLQVFACIQQPFISENYFIPGHPVLVADCISNKGPPSIA